MKAQVLGLLTLVGLSVQATEYTWTANEADPDNILTNACHFSKPPDEILPTDIVKFNAPLNVNLEPGCTWTSSICPRFGASAGNKLTVDLPNAVWRHADLASGAYSDKLRWNLYSSGYQQLCLTASSATAKGAFRLDNVKFTACETDGVYQFDLCRGTMDLRAPNGTDLGASLYWPTSKTMSNSQLRFHAGSHAIFPTLLVYAYCPTNEIVVDGGSHVFKSITMRAEDANSDVGSVPRTRITVTGEEAELALESFAATGEGHTYSVNVVSNGVLSFLGKSMSQAASGDMGRIVVNGASLMVTNIFDVEANKIYTMNSPNIYVTNGTMTVSRATGVEVNSGAFFKTSGGTLTFEDSTFTGDNIGLLGSTVLNLVRTAFTCSNKLYLGYNGTSTPTVNVRGGTFSFTASTTVGQSGKSVATLNLLDGAKASGTRVTLGSDAAATGVVNVVSGSLTLSENLVIGAQGAGTVNILGGTHKVHSVLMSNNEKASGMRTEFKQSGGELTTGSGLVSVFPTAGISGCEALVRLDGGVLYANSVSTGDGSAGGTADFVSDGGTIRATAKTAATFINGFRSARLGASGLRVETDQKLTIPQSLDNLPETEGLLVLGGSGTKTIAGTANTVAKIVAEEGEAVFADGAEAASKVTVAGGATVAFGTMGATGCLTGLTVGDTSGAGTIRMAEGESIRVTGPVDVVHVNLEFDQAYPLGTDKALMTCTQSVSDASRAAWQDAHIVSDTVEGTVARFTAETDEEGVTTFRMKVTAPETIYVRAETGDVVDSTSRSFADGDELVAVVSNGYAMTLSGKLGKGALRKVGGGRFELTNPLNELRGGIFTEAGLFDVVSMGALGWSSIGTGDFNLLGGTVAFSDANEELFPCRLVIDVDAPDGTTTNAAVLKADQPTTLGALQLKSGAILKRGAAALTIDPGPNTKTVLSVGNGWAAVGGAWPAPVDQVAVFDEDGTPPSVGFTGFGVAEGELVLKGDETTEFSIPNTSSVGIRATPVAVQPVLTVDGAKLTFGGDTKRFVVGGSQQEGDAATNAMFQVVNGAKVTVGSLVCANGAKAVSQPRVMIDAATVTCNNLNGGYDSGNKARPLFTLRQGAALYAKSVSHYGPADFDVSGGSVFGKNADGDSFAVKLTYYGGDWSFKSGAEFRCASIVFDKAKLTSNVLNLGFDGGKWLTGGADLVFAEPRLLSITALGEGLELPVADGTLRLATKVAGSGGLVKTGAGTLLVDPQEANDGTTATPLDDPLTLACTGVNRIEEGTLRIGAAEAIADAAKFAVTNGATLDLNGKTLTGVRLSGGGTVTGGTLNAAVVAVAAAGAAEDQPLFDNVVFTGRTSFDVSALPPVESVRTVVVARYAGTAPSTAGWRVRGQKNVGATFEASEGEVRATLSPVGIVLIVR